MSRAGTSGARVRLVGGALALAALSACGKKGPPLPPLRPVPGAVTDLSARRLASEVHLACTPPAANQDGSRPADVARVEVFALSVPEPRAADPRLVVDRGERVAVIAVAPNTADTAGKAETPAAPGPLSAVETLEPADFEPVAGLRPAAPRPGQEGVEPARPEVGAERGEPE
ncbi:MAG TPA: hypothetical protein VNI83_10600, partial [Vicinamibacterales bacterium]|nr:hypothetical protein [Vicinamibacterales bacterium]